MYDFKAMTVFAVVVESGSMQAASEVLGMTPSAVTQTVQKLENNLNIKLLNRTTRRLSVTEAGNAFYQYAAQLRTTAQDAFKSIDRLRTTPVGVLNIACVSGLLDSYLVHAFKNVLDAHPEFKLNISFEDRVVDLVTQQVDISLRAGTGVLADNMIARHIYDFEWAIVAHKDYLAGKKLPENLKELANLDWIGFSNEQFRTLTFSRQGKEISIQPRYRINSNSLYASRSLTQSGLGVSIQPVDDVKRQIAAGDLIPLFEDWRLPPVPLYLVTLQRVQTEKVRIACELISDYFQKLKN